MNIHQLAELGPEEVSRVLDSLSAEEKHSLQYKWDFWARPSQLAPEGNWTYWLLMAGRGFGKTRVGAEWVRAIAESGKVSRINLIAPTNGDIRGVMLEGESGLLTISPNWFLPKYEPSKRRVTWPNGVIGSLFSAEEPERLRGPQCGAFWADEIGAWKNADETWSNLQFGFRLGRNLKGVITTTPRPTKLVKKLHGMSRNRCVVTAGTTYDNRENLAPEFFEEVVTSYENTRLGRQELNGELLEDNPNALFTTEQIDLFRASSIPEDLERIVVAVDPAVTSNISSDETGIVVVGKKKDASGTDHFFVLMDASMTAASTDAWARKSVATYHAWKADKIIAESNNGGDLVVNTIRTVGSNVPVEKVIASRGKTKRAEPVAALYEQGRVHHVGSPEQFRKLEDQMLAWDPTLGDDQTSPDRMDALVWGISWLMAGKSRGMTQGRAM